MSIEKTPTKHVLEQKEKKQRIINCANIMKLETGLSR